MLTLPVPKVGTYTRRCRICDPLGSKQLIDIRRDDEKLHT